MTILPQVQTAFTPGTALLGGALIGMAAVLLMATHGRVAGISGMTARLVPPWQGDGLAGRLAFVVGLIVAAPVYGILTGAPVAQTVGTAPTLMALAGLLVGFGSVWGRGCTSGHGVCGLALMSPRSLVATLVFMAAAVITVFIVRHVVGG